MTAQNWTELTQFALELARASAEVILPFFRQDLEIDVKSGALWDPVTEGDRAGERIMRAMIEKRYPDHGIHGEEYGIKPARSGLTWVLDPVDGTRAFISGMPTWATLIGLTYEDKPMVGVMNQPFVGETFHGQIPPMPRGLIGAGKDRAAGRQRCCLKVAHRVGQHIGRERKNEIPRPR